jgi:hypothetical protein
MNRNWSSPKSGRWAVWSVVAMICAALFFQANHASSSRTFGPNPPAQSVHDDGRAGASTSAVDTLLW